MPLFLAVTNPTYFLLPLRNGWFSMFLFFFSFESFKKRSTCWGLRKFPFVLKLQQSRVSVQSNGVKWQETQQAHARWHAQREEGAWSGYKTSEPQEQLWGAPSLGLVTPGWLTFLTQRWAPNTSHFGQQCLLVPLLISHRHLSVQASH